ncbi:hypothetical protein K501DRAFT_239847 [Backusella circina FSU 941]|nr:hypothetical protein K501DRAFT_239847 [Backusella circina FSU 941]
MDSRIATIGSTKPTIASRRPMLNSQRSMSVLSINTKATYHDFVRRNSSATTSKNNRPIYHQSPGMSSEELSSKIADSFQEFSSMLSQLSTKTIPKTPPVVHPTSTAAAAAVVAAHVASSTSPPPPVPVASTDAVPTTTTNNTAARNIVRSETRPIPKKTQIKRTLSVPVLDIKNTKTEREKEQERRNEEEEEKKDNAIYFENTLGNMELGPRMLQKRLARAASIGDCNTLQLLLKDQRLDTNQSDDKQTGITPLMYAAYFGKIDCVKLLLAQNTLKLNAQDKKGWTALMWASHGQQMETVKLLLTCNARKDLTTKQGRTVFAFADGGIKDILGPPLPKKQKKDDESQPSPTSPIPAKKESATIAIPENTQVNHLSPLDGYSHFLSDLQHLSDPRKVPQVKSTPPSLNQLKNSRVLEKKEEECSNEDLASWEASLKSVHTFTWNECLPDQMFVFKQDDIAVLIEQALACVVSDPRQLKNISDAERWAPANILFLSARYAHYCSSRELLNSFFDTAINKLSKVIKAASRETQLSAFWISNLYQLLSYLKKDTEVSIATHENQQALSALIAESYTHFITESQKKIEKILEPAMMDYEPIHGLEEVDFVDDWQRFFRRTKTRKSVEESSSGPATPSISPSSLTLVLSQTKSMLQLYHVPPAIVIQAMAQCFHYLSCELFNKVLTIKRYMCRSKALQIRMNLSAMEEWVRESKLPTSLNDSFEPLVQLLQLLQCLSQMDDILMFSSTIQTFDKLNYLQVKRCVQSYRYEVSEARLPEEVEQLAIQLADDAMKEQRRKSMHRSSMESIRTTSTKKARPASISSLNSLITPKRKSSVEEDRTSFEEYDEESEEGDEEEGEKKNSKYLLPFSIPTTTALLQSWTEQQNKVRKQDDISEALYQEVKQKKLAEHSLLDKVYPAIPEEWLYRLDKRLSVR